MRTQGIGCPFSFFLFGEVLNMTSPYLIYTAFRKRRWVWASLNVSVRKSRTRADACEYD